MMRHSVRLLVVVQFCFIVAFAHPAVGRSREIQKGTTITGACLFGTSWGMSIIAGAMVASEASPDERGKIMTVGIPVAGPIIFSSMYGSADDGEDVLIWAAYLGVTAAQATGLYLLVRGIVGDLPHSEKISLSAFRKGSACGVRLKCLF